jgi:hypothetical protein
MVIGVYTGAGAGAGAGAGTGAGGGEELVTLTGVIAGVGAGSFEAGGLIGCVGGFGIRRGTLSPEVAGTSWGRKHSNKSFRRP